MIKYDEMVIPDSILYIFAVDWTSSQRAGLHFLVVMPSFSPSPSTTQQSNLPSPPSAPESINITVNPTSSHGQ